MVLTPNIDLPMSTSPASGRTMSPPDRVETEIVLTGVKHQCILLSALSSVVLVVSDCTVIACTIKCRYYVVLLLIR